MTNRWRAAVRWVEVADPGAIRRRAGGRAALAAATAWVVMRLLTAQIDGHVLPGPSLFAAVMCFSASLAIGDPRRAARRTTLLLAVFVAIATVATTAALADLAVLRDGVLLALMFASFAARRYGLRAGELVLVATIASYFTGTAGVHADDLGWYLTATVVGFTALLLWQQGLLPYDPARRLAAALRAYDRRAAELVATVRASVADRHGDDRAVLLSEAAAELQRVRGTRQVLESQLPGADPTGGHQASRLDELQLAVYSTEQGLAMMVEAAGQPPITTIDDGVAASVDEALGDVALMLRSPDADTGGRLVRRAVELRDQATAVVARDERDHTWVEPTVQLARGVQQVVRSVGRSRQLIAGPGPEPGSSTAVRHDVAAPATPSVRSVTRLHPTTVLGLQAVVAALVAAAVARLVGLEHVNWTYWTAFVIVAGSAGESSRRMVLRVAGTTAGAAAGAALALALPDRTIVVAAIAIVGVFMAIYEAPVSYTWMVCWLNVGFVVVFAEIGAGELELLRERALAAAIGGGVGAIVTATLLPIRVADRLRRAVAGYLGAVAHAVDEWAAVCADPTRRARADGASAGAEGQLDQIRAAAATAAFERNPFPGTQAPWTGYVVPVAAVGDALAAVARAAPDDEPSPPDRLDDIELIAARVIDDLGVLRVQLDPSRSSPPPSAAVTVAAMTTDEPGSRDVGRRLALGDGAVLAFQRLRRTVRDLTTAIAAPTTGSAPAALIQERTV